MVDLSLVNVCIFYFCPLFFNYEFIYNLKIYTKKIDNLKTNLFINNRINKMKKILAITSLLFASLSLFGAQACVQFFGGDFKLDNDAMPSNVKISKAGKAGLSIDLDVSSTKWQTLKIVGTAQKKTTLRLMYYSKRGKNAMPVFFDNIKVNGQLLPNGDFSSGDFDSWFLRSLLNVDNEENYPSIVFFFILCFLLLLRNFF
ncbi:MAG: hypothetical protein IKC88_02695 [Opitutales bacterium]|nr:hypothetical protein [Opitutales bacterium]